VKLFQNSGIYPTYLKRLNSLASSAKTHCERKQIFLQDRYGACHFLRPVLNGDDNAFFTNGDDVILQRLWAAENGMSIKSSLEDILLAQIEQHRTEIFYNLDPVRYGSEFVRKLPGCVRRTIAWRAAPSPGADFGAYDLLVCNFPSILENYRKIGWRTAYFFPSYDPEMDTFTKNSDRPLDVLFIGGYSRHHTRRARVLESVASLDPRFQVLYCLDESRVTRLADSPLGLLPGLSRYRRPLSIRRVTSAPVFGRELYKLMFSAKVVLNGAIDMAGEDRGNIRCFEALGCGALMLSDSGHYPAGFVDKETMRVYRSELEAVSLAEQLLKSWEDNEHIAVNGRNMIRERYSKAAQWSAFIEILDAL
jgi:hypothetical protein